MKRIILLLIVVLGLIGWFTIASPPAFKPRTLSDEKLWETIQNWRTSQNFPKYTKSDAVCSFANLRAKEIQTNYSHDGFFTNSKKPPFSSMDMAENLETDRNTEIDALLSWLDSPEHRKNLDTDYKYSCVKCLKTYCVQIFAKF